LKNSKNFIVGHDQARRKHATRFEWATGLSAASPATLKPITLRAFRYNPLPASHAYRLGVQPFCNPLLLGKTFQKFKTFGKFMARGS
jgi:hypothetical protein